MIITVAVKHRLCVLHRQQTVAPASISGVFQKPLHENIVKTSLLTKPAATTRLTVRKSERSEGFGHSAEDIDPVRAGLPPSAIRPFQLGPSNAAQTSRR